MDHEFSTKFSLGWILELPELFEIDPLGFWKLLLCVVAVFVSLFWAQIFLRGLIFRRYKIEYFVFLSVTIIWAYGFLTNAIWPDAKLLFSLVIFGVFFYGLHKTWRWLTKRSNWKTLEEDMGPESLKRFAQPSTVGRSSHKNAVQGLIDIYGLKKAYYFFWGGSLACISLLLFGLFASKWILLNSLALYEISLDWYTFRTSLYLLGLLWLPSWG